MFKTDTHTTEDQDRSVSGSRVTDRDSSNIKVASRPSGATTRSIISLTEISQANGQGTSHKASRVMMTLTKVFQTVQNSVRSVEYMVALTLLVYCVTVYIVLQ